MELSVTTNEAGKELRLLYKIRDNGRYFGKLVFDIT
jgi:hypothetical protein